MTTLLEMRGITKAFPGVKALDDVNLIVKKGEIHALVGENGAGKSTLMKVLSGVYPHGSYDGDIIYEGEVQRFQGIADTERSGIIIIHQELALVPLLSIAENIFLGNEIHQGGVINWPDTFSKSNELLKKVGLQEPSTARVDTLGVGKQQLVEIAKALAKEVKLLILDEPTSSLQENDSQKLLQMLMAFREQGITSILISHKLNEVRQVSDSITVLRDGAAVSTLNCRKEEISEDRIIMDMVGRDMEHRYPPRKPSVGERLFEVKNWNVFAEDHLDRQVIHDVNFHVARGEIVGIAGLMGSGRTELAMSIFGKSYGTSISGQVLMKDQTIDVSTVPAAIKNGVAYVTEDRKQLGLVLDENIVRNITLANLDAVSTNGVLEETAELQVAEQYRKKFSIRTPSIFQKVLNLSGGNQQKVVLSKWLFSAPDLLILDEPTRGIDVGAKYDIYTIINELAAAGKGVVFISSEMPELLGCCDRLYVMNEGAIVGERKASETSQEDIMSMIVQA